MTTTIRGVGLILLCRHGSHILTIEELRSKPHIAKRAGMLSFPLETVRDSESAPRALRRLLHEEIGVHPDQITTPEQCGVFWHDFGTVGVNYTIYMSQCQRRITVAPQDNDIAFHGWMAPYELLAHTPVRVEVRTFLEACLENGRTCP